MEGLPYYTDTDIERQSLFSDADIELPSYTDATADRDLDTQIFHEARRRAKYFSTDTYAFRRILQVLHNEPELTKRSAIAIFLYLWWITANLQQAPVGTDYMVLPRVHDAILGIWLSTLAHKSYEGRGAFGTESGDVGV
jgi:hypothetical protein